MNKKKTPGLTVIQILPALDSGGVERNTLEVGQHLVQQGQKSIVISGGGRLVQALVQSGSKHVQLPIGEKSLFLLRFIPLIRKIFSDADIVHVRSRFPAWLAWLAWRGMDKRHRPAFITTVHGAYSVNVYSGIMTRGERVIAVSDYIHDYVTRNYPETDPGRIITIHEGVDPGQYYNGFKPAESWLGDWYREYPQTGNKFILTLPGRITRLKGHEQFLKILSGLKNTGLDFYGLAVGDVHAAKRGYLEALKKTALDMGVDQHITFIGHRNDLREIMSISDIVLSISGQPEAFGRTVLESLSLGTPVIAYERGGPVEIMQAMFPDGLVPPDDISEVLARIIKFYQEKPAVSGNNPYLLQNMLDRTLSCYEELAGTGIRKVESDHG